LKTLLAGASLALLSLAGAHAAPPMGTLAVEVTNARNAKGRIHVEVCTQATFMKECPYFGTAPTIAGTTTVMIRGIPPGMYAVQVFHDENSDNKVNRVIFGLPREGVGFSNDALKGMSAPKWSDARFAFDGTFQKISLKLRYFL